MFRYLTLALVFVFSVGCSKGSVGYQYSVAGSIANDQIDPAANTKPETFRDGMVTIFASDGDKSMDDIAIPLKAVSSRRKLAGNDSLGASDEPVMFGMAGVPAQSAGKTTTADSSAPDESAPFVQADPARKVVYTANLALRVLNMEKARRAIDDIVKQHGAFYQDASLDRIAIRIKPESFDAALEQLGELGETLDRQVTSDDVTAQYTDLAIRIDVAEKSRQRLIDLLATAKEVKDVLEVERDIRRLTEEIETIKGQMRVMSDRIAYATINVQLLERMPDQTKLQRRLSENRFPWIGRLQLTTMMDSVRGDAPIDGGSWFKRTFAGPLFALDVKGDQGVPEGFVPLLHTRDLLFATTAEDYRLRVLYHEPRQESDLDFWARAIKAEFEYNRGYVVDEVAEFPLTGKGLTARLIKCEANMSGETWNYCVWLVQETDDADSVVSIEFACTQKDFETYRQRVEDAVKGIEVD